MAMPFAVPMVWSEPSNYSSDCYFCLRPPVASGMNRKKKQRIDYPNIPSAIRPVPHGEDLLAAGSSSCLTYTFAVYSVLSS